MEMKKNVGKVTKDESNVIYSLFVRKNGLEDLAKILTVDNSELYEKMVKDLGETNTAFQRWWDDMAEKYKWEYSEGSNWEIDFDTCNIYLIKE